MLEGAVVYEELGRALAPSPHFVSAVMSAGVLLRAGTDEQKQRVAAADRRRATRSSPTAWLEPGNGFGPRGRAGDARRADGDGFVLDGVKWHVPFASAATAIVVLARTGDGRRRRRPLPRRPGRRRASRSTQQLTIASDTQYAVDARRACGCRRRRASAAPGTGWATWNDDDARRDHPARRAGRSAARAYALEITVQYAKDREQFDKPLGAFQAIAHYLADAATAVDGARDPRVRGGVGARERPADRPARADGEAVRVPDVPRRHRDGAAGLRRRRLHARVRHPALLPAGQAAADLVVGRPRPRGARRRTRCSTTARSSRPW